MKSYGIKKGGIKMYSTLSSLTKWVIILIWEVGNIKERTWILKVWDHDLNLWPVEFGPTTQICQSNGGIQKSDGAGSL